MRSYERFQIHIDDSGAAGNVPHKFTFRLNSTVKKVHGVFLIGANPFDVEMGYQMGIKLDNVEMLPREFHTALMTFNTQVPLSDVVVPTPFDNVSGNSINVDVEVSRVAFPDGSPVNPRYNAYLYLATEV